MGPEVHLRLRLRSWAIPGPLTGILCDARVLREIVSCQRRGITAKSVQLSPARHEIPNHVDGDVLPILCVILVAVRLRQTIHAAILERHPHAEPYAALVLSGGYEEAGDNGRFEVRAGDVVFHDRFEAHRNRFLEKGAVVLNLPLGPDDHFVACLARIADPDAIIKEAQKNLQDAVSLLFSAATLRCPAEADWPDALALELLRCPSLRLADWGERNRLASWTISRGFSQVFGITPEAFRARARARRAWKAIQNTEVALATIAAAEGFADQAHMTRSIRQLTGRAPCAWRSANRFKTAAAERFKT